MPAGLVETLAKFVKRLAAFVLKVWSLLGGNVDDVPEFDDIMNE